MSCTVSISRLSLGKEQSPTPDEKKGERFSLSQPLLAVCNVMRKELTLEEDVNPTCYFFSKFSMVASAVCLFLGSSSGNEVADK